MERSEKVFKEFIDLCREVTSNDIVVLELLQKRYNRTNLHFLWSNEFPDLIDRCSQKIKADRDNKYVYIKEFTTELKAYKAKPLKHLRDARGGEGGSQIRKAEACPELEPPAKKPKLKNDSGNVSLTPKPRFETTPQFVKTAACHVRTPSCTLIPLSLIGESPFGSNKDAGSLHSTEETSKSDERTLNASGTKGKQSIVSPVKISQVMDLHLPELRVVLEKSDLELDKSFSARQNLVESSSDAETDHNPSTERCARLMQLEEEARDSRLQKHIKKLELLLKKISDEVKRLQESELSLDDMDQEDSSYTLEDRYKKRFVKVWNRLCQLKGRDTTTGREIERKLNYCGTNYPEVNKSISRFVNKFHTFPDYSDIHAIISRCNRKHNLGIRKSAVDRLAREAFTEVGNILQKRRMADHLENFGCHLTENLKPRDDPALFDSHLRQRLEDNLRLSKTKLDEVISKYAQRQDEDPGEEEEDDDEEEQEEEVEEDEKKFLEDMEQMEDNVLTNESYAEEEEEEEKKDAEERLSKENLTTKGSEESSLSVEMDNVEEVDGSSVHLCSDQESLSLYGDSVDQRIQPPSETSQMPIKTCSAHLQLNALAVELEPTVLSSKNENDKALDVEKTEEESVDVTIIDLHPSSPTNLQVVPPSKTTDSLSCILSSEVIDSGDAAAVSQSPSFGSASDEVESVHTLVPDATPIDVICLDDDTSSPLKKKSHPVNGAAEHQVIANGTVKQTNSTQQQSNLALGLVRLKPPCENVMRKFATFDMSHRKALAVRQPTVDVSAPTEAVTQSSDEEDVVEILSIPGPNDRTEFGSAAFGKEVRSSQVVNTTQIGSRLGRKNGSGIGDECCIMTTVEEHVVSTVVTTSKEERSNGVRGQQMEMKQHTRKTMRVIGQIVHFNAGRNEQQQQQQMNQMMHGCSRMNQMNQQHTVNHVVHQSQSNLISSASRQSRASQVKRGGHVVPSVPLQKQLDDISSQIVSSIFKSQPKKSSSSDSDVIICDDVSASTETTAAMTTDRVLKANRLGVTQANWVTGNPCRNGGYDMEARKTVARTSQGLGPLLAADSSLWDKNRAPLPPKQMPCPSRTLPQPPEVIELN